MAITTIATVLLTVGVTRFLEHFIFDRRKGNGRTWQQHDDIPLVEAEEA